MRVAAIYDVHGNLPALEAIIADIDRVEADVILVGGDLATEFFEKVAAERARQPGRHVAPMVSDAP